MKFEEMLAKQKQSNVEKFIEAGKKEQSSFSADDRFWKPTLDKAGNAFVVLRFLPAPDSEIPWVKYFSHGFKGDSGQWFIENCPTSIGQSCPVCEANSVLWESDKDTVRKRKRRVHYVSNILVVKDSGEPENNGKVFLYKYGVKVFEKLMEAMEPAFEDENPVNPFNLLKGANFKLKVKQVDGYWNYSSSEFDSQSAVYDGDEEKLKELFNQLHPIVTFHDPGEYKQYDELQKRLNLVLGIPEPTSRYRSEPEPSFDSSSDSGEEDDDMDYFRKLSNDLDD